MQRTHRRQHPVMNRVVKLALVMLFIHALVQFVRLHMR